MNNIDFIQERLISSGRLGIGRISLLSLTAIVLFLPTPGFSQTDDRRGCHRSTVEDFAPSLGPKARAFLAELKAALKSGDKKRVAGLVHYPLKVTSSHGNRVVRSSTEFVKDYDHLLTPLVTKAVEQQVPACLFANYQGVMIGDGEIWFEEQQNGSMKIKTINH